MLFQPPLHGKPALLRHGKLHAILHGAFFIAVWTMPAFGDNAALCIVNLLWRCHHHIGLSAEPERAAGSGKNIVHGKCVQCGNKQGLHTK